VINVTGAFVMGLLSTLMGIDWRDRFGNFFTALVLTGLLGGYTTFSSYELDTVTAYNKRERGIAFLYWVAQWLDFYGALGWWIAIQIVLF
jgi:CrcB protein